MNWLYACFVGKSSWPELVGWCGELAAATIQKEQPDMYVIIARPGSTTPLPGHFTCARVVVRVDEKGVVDRVPMAG